MGWALWVASWAAACTVPNPWYRPRPPVEDAAEVVLDAASDPDGERAAETTPADSPRPDLPAAGDGGALDSAGAPSDSVARDGKNAPDSLAPDSLAGDGSAASDSEASGDRFDAPDAAPAVPSLAHWRLDEPSGKAAADEAGRNPGTLSPGAVFVSSPFSPQARFPNRGAVELDGNSHVTLGATGLPALDQPMTVSVWIFIPAATLPLTGRHNVVVLKNEVAKESLQIGIQNGYPTAWRWASGPLFGSAPFSVNLAPGWHHLAYTSDGMLQRFFVEGTLVEAIAAPLPVVAVTAALLGTFDAASGAERFTGRIDDVRIYDVALTLAQVAALAGGEP